MSAPTGPLMEETNFSSTPLARSAPVSSLILCPVSYTHLGSAATAEAGFTAGVPGATLGKAVVANDRAQVAWNATVAVRNEVVSAYQSIMNMQF